MTSDAVQFRRDFWTKYAELYPDDGVPPGWGRSNVWIPVESVDLNISLALLHWGVGLWLRGRKGESWDDAEPRVNPLRDSFREAVGDAFCGRPHLRPGTEWKDATGGFDARREFDAANPENWPDMAAWLHYMLHIYQRVIENALVPQG